MTHVLLTNDDGVAKEGLRAFRDQLIALGFKVSVMAPAANESGRARAVSCYVPIEVKLIDEGWHPVFACSGSPVDCVRLGLLSGLLEDIDLVASGINHGVNLGDDATYSGTLGAALEGALHGKPAIAVSQQDDALDYSLLSNGEHSFGEAWIAGALAKLVVQDPPSVPVALTVNIPKASKARAELTRPARFSYPAGWSPPDRLDDGSWHVWPYARPGYPDPGFGSDPGTDLDAVKRGFVSISPVVASFRLDGQATAEAWARRIAASWNKHHL